MIGKRPYEFMTRYTQQREWIEGLGILIPIALFCFEIGGGTFIFSSLFGNLWGAATGWLLCAFGALCFFAHAGNKMAAIRGFRRPGSSWISRGMTFISLFLILGIIYMALGYFADIEVMTLVAVTNVFAFLVMIYAGFVLCYVNSLPLWNTALLPILVVVSGFWEGAEITMGTGLASTAFEKIAPTIEMYIRILILAFIVILTSYLISIRYGSPAGRVSIREITLGRGKALFWTLVVAVGLAFPLTVVAYGFIVPLEEISKGLLIAALFCEIAGDFTVRYLIMKNAFYNPLTPISDVPLV